MRAEPSRAVLFEPEYVVEVEDAATENATIEDRYTTGSDATGSEVDAALVQRIAAGDPSAETELIDRFDRSLIRMLNNLTNDPSLAEDIRQETLWIVLDQIRQGRVREPASLRGFVRGTARNLLYTTRRRHLRRPNLRPSWVPDQPIDDETPLNQVLDRENHERLRRSLAALRSELDRELLRRVYLADEGKDAVCRALGLAPEQYKKALYRARARLRTHFERTAKRDALPRWAAISQTGRLHL
ncbi:MAG: sigma-70 family RNA polymerase sigma factor [Acidobacteriota bacterium]